jgi:hypothetical protein
MGWHDMISLALPRKKRPLPAATYVVYIVLPKHGPTDPIYVGLTRAEAERLARWFDRKKDAGVISDYYLGPPPPREHRQVQILTPITFRRFVADLLELESGLLE